MTHSRMLDRLPSVLVTSNRNELKLYQDNIVYLNDGDNFELRFFNPTQEKVGVEIMFNGIKKGDSYLVLNPGQDVILDRFLDEQRKMLFETYVVNGNNQEAVEAIQQNGIITFNFYKEYFNSFNSNQPDVNINYNFPPKPYNTSYTKTLSRGVAGSSSSAGTSGNSGTKGMAGTSGSLSPSNFGNATTTVGNTYSTLSNTNGIGNIYYSNTSTWTSSFKSPGVFTTEIDQSFASMDMLDLEESELETGRIEKGEVSNQTLKTINAQFSPTKFHSVSYKLLPYSAKNTTVGEIREYCGDCGYRLRKQTWKFCPKCGEKIN